MVVERGRRVVALRGEGCESGGERYIGVLAKGRGLPPKASETKGV